MESAECTGSAHQPPLAPQAVSRRSAAFWNLVFGYGNLAAVLVRNIALVPVYQRLIERQEFDAWLSSGGVLAGLTALDFGLMGVLQQQAAVAYGAGDLPRLSRVVGTGLVATGLICIPLVLAGVALGWFIPGWYELAGTTARNVSAAFIIGAVANSLQLFSYATGGVLRSLQRPLLPGALRLGAEVASIGVTIVALFWGWGLYAIAWGLVCRAVLEIGGNLGGFAWIFGVRMRLTLTVSLAEAADLIRFSVYQFLAQLAGRLKLSIDPMLIAIFLGAETGAAYALTVRAHETVRMFAMQVGGALTPVMAHIHGEGMTARLRQVVIELFRINTIVAVIGMAGVVAFNRQFVSLWVGPERYVGDTLTILVALWGVGSLWAATTYDALFAIGDFLRTCVLIWYETLIRYPLIILMLALQQLWGVPAASLLAQALALNVFMTSRMFRMLEFTPHEMKTVGTIAARHLALPTMLAALFLVVQPPMNDWGTLSVYGAAFVAIGVCASLMIDPALRELLRRRGRPA